MITIFCWVWPANPEMVNERITPNTLVGERRGVRARCCSGERPWAKLCLRFYCEFNCLANHVQGKELVKYVTTTGACILNPFPGWDPWVTERIRLRSAKKLQRGPSIWALLGFSVSLIQWGILQVRFYLSRHCESPQFSSKMPTLLVLWVFYQVLII